MAAVTPLCVTSTGQTRPYSTGASDSLTGATTYPVAPSGGTYTTAAAGSNAVALGDVASGAVANSIAIGHAAVINSSSTVRSVVIGQGASFAASSGGVIVGGTAAATTVAGVVIVGLGASITGSFGTAVGAGASVSGNGGSCALGTGSTASGVNGAIAIGPSATAARESSIAIGSVVTINAGAVDSSIAIGNNAGFGASAGGVNISTGNCNVANVVVVGLGASTNAAGSTIVGQSASSSASNSIAMGFGAQIVTGATTRSVAIGEGVVFTGAGGGVIVGGTSASTAFVNTVIVGLSSTVTASGGTVVGASASAGSSAVAVGYSTTASGTDAIAIGVGTTCTSSGIVIGSGGSTVAGSAGIALGFGCSIGASYTDCVMINSTATASRQFFVGSSAHAINTVLIGEGESTTALTQSSVTYRATRIATSETDESGQSIIWQSGAGTGAATVSTISFETPTATASGTTQQALATRFTIAEALLTIADAHNIAVGTTTGTKFGTATTQKLGWWNSAPVVQSAVASLTNNVTSGGTTDVIDNFTDLTVYANDATTIRNDIYQLSRKLKDVVDAMRLYGLLG